MQNLNSEFFSLRGTDIVNLHSTASNRVYNMSQKLFRHNIKISQRGMRFIKNFSLRSAQCTRDFNNKVDDTFC